MGSVRVKLKVLWLFFLYVNVIIPMHGAVSPDSLFKAVKMQDILQVRIILQSLTESNRKTVLEWQSKPEVRTALMQCTIDKNLHIASLLVHAGANMFANDYTGTSPVSYVTDTHHRNLELLEVFIKTPSEFFLKRIEWTLLNDLLNVDSPFTLEQNRQLIKALLSMRSSLLAYQWLEGLSAKSALIQNDELIKKKYLPIYKAIAPSLLAHYKNYYKSEAEKIMHAMNDVNKSSTFMKSLPIELKNLIVEAYSESLIYTYRKQSDRIMACAD